MADLKTVYRAETKDLAEYNLLKLEEKWGSKYPMVIKSGSVRRTVSGEVKLMLKVLPEAEPVGEENIQLGDRESPVLEGMSPLFFYVQYGTIYLFKQGVFARK